MKTSAEGRAFIKGSEGFVSKPTPDNGKMAWGYGHDQLPGEPLPESITPDEADVLLQQDLAKIEPRVSELAPWATQTQFDALIDFAYNLGLVALTTMLHHGQEQVPTQIPAWCYMHVNGVAQKSEGLLARRNKEVRLFTTGQYA